MSEEEGLMAEQHSTTTSSIFFIGYVNYYWYFSTRRTRPQVFLNLFQPLNLT